MLFVFLFAPFLAFIAYRLVRWVQNYLVARTFSLPIILIPIDFNDVWWMPIRPLFSCIESLPFGLGYWYVYSEMGWPTVDEARTTSRLGENFVLCSPMSNQIVSCYKPTLNKIFNEHKNWSMPPAQSQLFAVYGQNVSSTHGAEWQRHRKITTSAFNERTLVEVWGESKHRVKVADFGDGQMTLDGIRNSFNVLAMSVLAQVAFGGDTDLTSIRPGHKDSLMGCLGTILQNILLTLAFGSVPAPEWMLPGPLKRVKAALIEFRLYMEEFILRDMQAAKSDTTRKGLLSSMIRANEAEKEGVTKNAGRPSYLTETELYGNVFVFNLAGYETTASTFTFALSYLALHPEVQDWIAEEIQSKYSEDAAYSETFPQLVRCLATMYEALRLAGPAPLLVRQSNEPQEVEVLSKAGPKTIVVPPGTLIGSHFYGGHLSPKWGADALEFNPKRFISKSKTGEEVLSVPEDLMFMPWIMGPRVCPGRKFSQVEYVAMVAELFSRYRLEADRWAGETESSAQSRLRRVLSEKYFNVSTYLKRPTDAGVRFVRREKA